MDIQHETFGGYGVAEQIQIGSGERLQKTHPAGTVSEAVMSLQRDSPVEIVQTN